MGNKLPKIIATNVIRSSKKGESHGGIFLVDLETGEHIIQKNWDNINIEWEGRGGDRGLRGICFYDDKIIFAASNEIFFFNKEFNIIDSITNPYLKSIHEIHINGSRLFISSTAYDAILVLNLEEMRFESGYHIFAGKYRQIFYDREFPVYPKIFHFDPESKINIPKLDKFHINQVFVSDGDIHFSGVRLHNLFRISNNKVKSVSVIPKGTHNTMSYRDGLLMNNTKLDSIIFTDFKENILKQFALKKFNVDEMINTDIPNDHARQAFGRGLATYGELIIGGSSPATISVYDFNKGERIKTINLSMDIRNAIHGLEVYPYQNSEK